MEMQRTLDGQTRKMESSQTLWNYMQDSLDHKKPLSPGWIRHCTSSLSRSKLKLKDARDRLHSDDPYFAFDKNPGVYCVHECDPESKFWYPIPI